MTLQQCQAYAQAQGYNIIGMQYGAPGQSNPPQCFVGNDPTLQIYQKIGKYSGDCTPILATGDADVNSIYVYQ